jgi:hypothetical protein
VHPGDGVQHAVDFGVVLCAGEGVGVFLDGDDACPLFGEGEGDDVAAGAGEDVDESVVVFSGGGEVFGDFSRGVLVEV